jgi:hypothetical protein
MILYITWGLQKHTRVSKYTNDDCDGDGGGGDGGGGDDDDDDDDDDDCDLDEDVLGNTVFPNNRRNEENIRSDIVK